MQITVFKKTVFGRDLIYPHCDKAQLFAQLCKSQTLTNRDLELIRDLGYQIQERFGRNIWGAD